MTITSGTTHELREVELPSGPARAAVFFRSYDAAVEEVWDACTNPERLARWYAPVEGDLVLGGHFTQGNFGSGIVLECEAPRRLVIDLGGGGTDQVQLSLTAREDGGTDLEFQHATTMDTHTIGGQVYDAVYCMGGGYGPRLVALEQHLHGTLPSDVDASELHLRAEYRDAIDGSMAEIERLLRSSGLHRL